MKKHFTLLVFATLSAGVCARLTYAAAGDIYNLGTLGGTVSVGHAINASGQVAGYSFTTADSAFRAFLYTGTPGSGGAMADLGNLSGPNSSFAYAINASGQVAGYSATGNNGPYHAFRYSGTPGSGGVMHDLGTLGEWGSSFGHAINASGQVTGESDSHAFLYSGTPGSGGAMVDLGTLSGPQSIGYAINDSARVTGESWIDMPDEYGDVPTHAFLYTGTPDSGGAMADLGTIAGTFSSGRAINASGQVTGSSSTTDYGDVHAFLYTGTPGSGGAMADLGTLGGSNSHGAAINRFGHVVGSSATTPVIGWVDGPDHAFLYTGTPGVNGVMIDLDDWLADNNPAEGSKWTLQWASGLTDTGLIVGTGVYNDGVGGLSDGYRPFVLDASSLVHPIPGDFNHDGTVDAADYVVWRKNPGGIYTQNDFNLWRTHFGQPGCGGSVASANATVPEPTTLALLMLVTASWCIRRGRAA